MTKFASFGLTTLTVAALLAGAGRLCPQWSAGLGLDFWNLSELHGRLEREARKSADLDRRLEIVLQRIEGKERVVKELIADRMSLREAAARFRILNETADCVNPYRTFFPAESAEESVCLQVMAWVDSKVELQPCRRQAVMRRLEEELREVVGSPSTNGTP